MGHHTIRIALIILTVCSLSARTRQGSGVRAQEDCDFSTTKQDPFNHKSLYTVGVHSVRGLDVTLYETNKIYAEYLTQTAGKKFDPPIEFRVVPYYFGDLFSAIENGEVDFVYSNPGVFSCIGVEFGATALATVVKALTTHGRTYDLDVYGGVIAARRDNDQINTITDLKDKIIGAGSIVDLMGGQMQIYEMGRAGLSYVNDPKQVIFTDNQYDIVNGVLDGIYDVGFVRTNQIEITTDSAGEFLDPDLFKIIDPKIFVMDDGELFPFLHSTEILPEWPFSSLMTVPEDVQRAVQSALIDFGQYALMGKIQDCSSGSRSPNASDWCNDIELKTTTLRTPCNATEDLLALAAEASRISRMSSFRPARSYFYLRAILEETGFLIQDSDGWHCLRPSNLHEGITCPPGHFKRDVEEFENGCKHIGLTCGAEDHTCFCKPCVEAFDVDVYHLDDGQVDPHMVETYGASLPGCKKMEICGILKQRESITMRIYDNMLRDGANVTAICTHGDDDHNTIPVTNIPGTYGYEFTITDNQVRVHVVEVFINGILTSQSPIRIAVEEADCDSQYGEGSNRVPDSEGNCVCASYTHEIAGSCIESAGYFLIIFSVVFVAVGILLFFYIGYKKKQSDSVWHINVEELHFNEPPEIIGAGGFGVVILGQYRGTKVAVKRVLPPSKSSKGYKGSRISGQSDDVEAAATTTDKSRLDSNSKEAKRMSGIKKNETKTKRDVKFGDSKRSGDIESQETTTKSESMEPRGGLSASNRDWERLLMTKHSNNDVLKLLESATSSAHGSEELYEASTSKSFDLVRFLPMCLRFDAHSQRVAEFVSEMRMLSRLRHPCITTVMGAVVANAVDPMLGKRNS